MGNKSWFNGHAHTYYSFLDGYSRPKVYAERAIELGMPAAVITDHGHVHGWPEHEKMCKKVGIKPIFGLEAYQARKTRFDVDEEERSGPATLEWEQRGPYHLTIFAKDRAGYNNIIKLSSKAYMQGYFVKPRLDKELIADHSDGIIILSGCLGGEVSQALLRGDFDAALKSAATMQEIVGRENYFIEIHDHGIPEQLQVKKDLIKIAQMIGAKIAPSADCHYVHKHDAPFHDAMLCVSTKATIDQEKRFKFYNDEFYLKSREEMEKDFEPEWLDNTLEIADMCNVEIERGEYYFPNYIPPNNKTQDDFLEEQLMLGLKKKYGDPIPKDIIERAEHEMNVIGPAGFIPYFLIVADIVNWAKQNGILVGKGRGSVAGSIVSYALGITDIDPIKYNLLFERFLIEGRSTMPDVDLDFDDRYRDEVVEYVRSKYGHDHVAHIGTFSTIKAKSAIQDAGRVLGYDFTTTNKISNLVPPPVNGVTKTLEECMQDPEFSSLYNSDSDAKKIIDVAFGLEGTFRQPGVHASGILITNKPVIEYVPVLQKTNKDGTKGPVVTQWAGEEIEYNGLLKIDFLGLRNLAIVDTCIKNVERYRGIKIDIDNIPMDDKATFDLYKNAHTISCFQVGNEGMRALMHEMSPDNIFDIMALISLFRPGPMGSGMHRMYTDRKHGRAMLDYVHPLLREDLEDTYGVFIYQENLLTAARILAGFTAAEADDLRKAVGKKKPEVMVKIRKDFIQGCKKTNNIKESVAEKIFNDIEYFAGYGFGRGHAASYAELSYLTAYLKANYPVEYVAAILDSVSSGKNDPETLTEYLNEAERMEISVLPPSIKRSGRSFDVISDNEILFGLSGIDGIGESAVSSLVCDDTRANWETLTDMFKNADERILNKGIFENLLYAGALDEILPEDDAEITELHKIETLIKEKEKLGVYLTENPVEKLNHILKLQRSHSIAEAIKFNRKTLVKLAGLVENFTESKTKTGKKIWRFTLRDETGSIQCFGYNALVSQMTTKIQNNMFYCIEGAIAGDRIDIGLKNLILNYFEPFELDIINAKPPIIIDFDGMPSAILMKEITTLLDKSKGNTKCQFRYKLDDKIIVTEFKHKIGDEMKDLITEMIQLSKIEVFA